MMGFLKGILHNRYRAVREARFEKAKTFFAKSDPHREARIAEHVAVARNFIADSVARAAVEDHPRPIADTYVPTNAIADIGLIQHPLVKYDAKGAVKL